MPKKIPYNTQEEWHTLRAEDVTSTESSALFGLSPYCSDFELYHRKHDDVAVEFTENERMKWGNRLEDAIAQGFGEDNNLAVFAMKDYYRHDEEPRMGCSCDYQAYTKYNRREGCVEDDPVGIEIKAVDYLIYRDQWTPEEAPTHIETQVQHQMEVMGWECCYIVALVGGNDLKVIKRMRDRETGKNIREAIAQFWHDVAHNNAPAPDFINDADYILSVVQKSGGKLLQDESYTDDFVAYEDAKASAKEAEEYKKSIKTRLLYEIGEEYGKVEAGGLRLSCGMTKGSEGTLVTEAMVGTYIGGRKPFRQFVVNKIGAKKA